MNAKNDRCGAERTPTAAEAIAAGIAGTDGRALHPELLGDVVGVEVERLATFGMIDERAQERLQLPLPLDPAAAAVWLETLGRRLAAYPPWFALLSSLARQMRSSADVRVAELFLRRILLGLSMRFAVERHSKVQS